MAPPKTMATSQQQQSQQQTKGRTSQGDQASKSKKRKGKQQLTNNSAQPQQNVFDIEEQQVNDTSKSLGPTIDKENSYTKTALKQSLLQANEQHETISTTPSERLFIKQQTNLVPLPYEKESSNLVVAERKRDPIVQTNTGLAKQISTEEPDEIDAGIELDGSSNSSSSVKDMNEDQIKSTSVSPVMAQNIILNENRDKTKHAVVNTPIEQMAGPVCTDTNLLSLPITKKIGSTKTQQLAANQQVIDADEQQLQQKLQSKQRKPSIQGNISAGSHNTSNSTPNNAPQSPALCKICDQHVYQMERMMAEKSVYHKSCFRCFQCKIQLRIDNYSSHDGQVYCKAHHRQIFQPQVKLDSEEDVDIVAKSTSKVVDDYLLQRGRLSDLSFSFLQPKPEGIRKRQMIICENEPAELPEDVVRSDTKVDDGIDRLNLNMSNILEKFEKGTTGNGEDSQPSSAGIFIEKPSFNIRKTLMAFEAQTINSFDDDDDDAKRAERTEKPVVKKLTNFSGFLNRQSSTESETPALVKPLAVKRSESLMMRLKKYESRIAGEQVADDASDDDENNNNLGDNNISKKGDLNKQIIGRDNIVPKKLASIDLSSLKNQWETGDISKRQFNEDNFEAGETNGNTTSDKCNGYCPSAEKNEELVRIRQQLAKKRSSGSSSIKNIYENAIKEAQQTQAPRLNSSDLSALNGLSTTEIQQQLLQNGSQDNQKSSTPSTPNKDHFQLNLSNKANKLKEKFEQGLINNSSYDDSDENDGDNERTMSKLEQIRQEKLEDLSIFTEGEIKAREARSMFQQIDRRLSAASTHRQSLQPNAKSLATISASMQAKLQNQMNTTSANEVQNGRANTNDNHLDRCEQVTEKQKPIRLMNNVRT